MWPFTRSKAGRDWGRPLLLSFAAPVFLLAAGGAGGIRGCLFDSPQAGYVGTSTCMGCHDGRSAPDMRHFRDSAHSRVSCETCHGPGYAHVQAGGRGGLFIDNPARLPFTQQAEVCAQCHGDTVAGYKRTRHATARAASCHDCHDVHQRSGLRVKQDGPVAGRVEIFAELCSKCHGVQADQFLESGHARAGVATCVSCHDMHKAEMFTADPIDNSLCLQCHGSRFLGFNTEENIDFHTGEFHPVDPAGSGASRCIACHMPPLQQQGQPNVPHDHTMMTFPPAASNELMEQGVIPVPPNSCAGIAGCHDPNVPGSGTPFDVNDPLDNRFLQELYESIGAIP